MPDRDFEPFFKQHEVYTTEGCYRSLLRAGIFLDHPHFSATLPGYRGGVVQLTERVLKVHGDQKYNAVIYLVDPRDSSSNFPETNALKRECVVNETPFLATSRSAREWAAQRWEGGARFFLGDDNRFGRPAFRPLRDQTIALIAHNRKKGGMLDFAAAFFDVLAHFRARIGTGTTATLLRGTNRSPYSSYRR